MFIGVYKNLENLVISHVLDYVYSQSQAVVKPVKYSRVSLNFTIKNNFFKSNLNMSKFFIALGFS